MVAGRVGGGFGGKQEVLTEDVVALAALSSTARCSLNSPGPSSSPPPPPGIPSPSISRPAPAATGRLTALKLEVLTNTGAYGNHATGVMFHGCGESMAVYNCANKKVDAHAVYTNTVPSGAFRGYGLEPDDLRDRIRHRRARAPGSAWTRWSSAAATWSGKATTCSPRTPSPEDVRYGSYGLDQCTKPGGGRPGPRPGTLPRGRPRGPARTGWSARAPRCP